MGLFAGCIVMWSAVFILNTLDLRFVLPEIPLFQISWIGIGAGAFMGFFVVMLASKAPAKKASQVSPQAAVTGNAIPKNHQNANRAVSSKLSIDTSMGIHHTVSNKKNLLLTSGSYALSIMLFLSFNVFIIFMEFAVNPLKPYAPDISLVATDGIPLIEHSLLDKLRSLPHIKQLYGRMFYYDIPSSANGKNGSATLISYDEPQFDWAEEMLIKGSMTDVRNGNGVLVGCDKTGESPWNIGDTITFDLDGKSQELYVSGILSDMPFNAESSEWIVVCSETTFTEMTGMMDYTIIDMQVNEDISMQVADFIPSEIKLLDKQQGNQETLTAYYTMSVFVYGFVFVIALVAFINIINTVNTSISSRIEHYGVMRAVGMSVKQMKRMVFAETLTYAVTGSVVGGILGLILHRLFYQMMITSNWGEPWNPPLIVLAIVVFVTILTTFIAVIAPARKIEKTSIVNVVNAG